MKTGTLLQLLILLFAHASFAQSEGENCIDGKPAINIDLSAFTYQDCSYVAKDIPYSLKEAENYDRYRLICQCYTNQKNLQSQSTREEVKANLFKDPVRKALVSAARSNDLFVLLQSGAIIQAASIIPDKYRDAKNSKTAENYINSYSLFLNSEKPESLDVARQKMGKEALDNILVKEESSKCVSMEEFLSFQRIPQNDSFYSELAKETEFNPERWNIWSLNENLKNYVTRHKSIKTLGDLKGDKEVGWMIERINFLVENPLYMNIFSQLSNSTKENQDLLADIQGRLFQTIKNNYNCNEPYVKCVAQKRKKNAERDFEFFNNANVQKVARAGGEDNLKKVDGFIQKKLSLSLGGPALPSTSASYSDENINELTFLNRSIASLDPEQVQKIPNACTTVFNFFNSRGDDEKRAREVLGDLFGRLSRKGSLNPDTNEAYKNFAAEVCENPRYSKDHKKMLTFAEYEKSRCPSGKCSDRKNIIHDFLQNYPDPSLDLGANSSTFGEFISKGPSKKVKKETLSAAIERNVAPVLSAWENPSATGADPFFPSVASNPVDASAQVSPQARSSSTFAATRDTDSEQTSDSSTALATTATAAINPNTATTTQVTTAGNFAIDPVRTERQTPAVSNSAQAETEVAKDAESKDTSVTDSLQAQIKDLQNQLAAKNAPSTQSTEYKKILDELNALKEQKEKKKEEAEKAELAQASEASLSRAPASSGLTTPNTQAVSNTQAIAPTQTTNSVAPNSVFLQSGSGSFGGQASLGSVSGGARAISDGYQKALNDKYKISPEAGIVVVKEGDVSSRLPASVGSNGQAPSYSVPVSQELFNSLAQDPVKAQLELQKEFEQKFKTLSGKGASGLVTVTSGSAVPLTFRMYKVDNRIYLEPVRKNTLRDLENLTRRQ